MQKKKYIYIIYIPNSFLCLHVNTFLISVYFYLFQSNLKHRWNLKAADLRTLSLLSYERATSEQEHF